MDQKDKNDSKREKIDDLDIKLQKVLEKKLLLIQNKFRLMQNYSTEQLEKDLNELNDCIGKSNDETEGQSNLIAKKIEIIERIMVLSF